MMRTHAKYLIDLLEGVSTAREQWLIASQAVI